MIAVARQSAQLADLVAELGPAHSRLPLDVSDPQAWADAMPDIDRDGPIHGLVAAAGVLGPIGSIDEIDPRELRRTLAVNLEGTALALHHLLPRIERAGGGAAVTFSGGGATGPLARYDAYAASKAGVVRLTENVALDFAPRGVTVNAVAPGFVATGIHEGTLRAGPRAAGVDYFDRTRADLAAGGVPPELTADLVTFLLGPAAREISGKLISAQWDPWREQQFRLRLATEPSLGTLRRIDDHAFTTS